MKRAILSSLEAERYRRNLEAVRDEAVRYARSRVMDECRGLGVTDAREAAKSIVSEAVDAYGTYAQSLACDLFDELAEAAESELRADMFDDLTDPEDVDRKVRYFARLLPEDLAGFADRCAARAGFYVWREAIVCTAKNVEESQ